MLFSLQGVLRMKISLTKINDPTMKFLQERHISYVKKQFERPVSMRNPISPKTNMFKDFLVLIGVLPIKKPSIK